MSVITRKHKLLLYIEKEDKLLYKILNETKNDFITEEFNYYYLETNYTEDKIYKILTDIIKYRDFYKVNHCNRCIICRKTKKHSMEYRSNETINNKAIIYLSPGNAIDNETFFICHHFILEIDKCINEHNNFSLVFDFNNYSFTSMIRDTETAYNLSKILQNLYNSRLDTIYLIDSPFYIKPLLQMMKTMFHDSIYKKIKHITQIDYLHLINK